MTRYKVIIDGSQGQLELTTKPQPNEEAAKAVGLKLYTEHVRGENARVLTCQPLEN